MVLDFEAALDVVRDAAAGLRVPGRAERVPLPASFGRVLAEPIHADRDQPGFDRSTRDGFAVRANDLAVGNLAPGDLAAGGLAAGDLRIAGQLRAGGVWTEALAPGTALEIMTGAGVPAGADAVVMVEHVERAGDTLRLAAGRTLAAGENIVPRGSEARAGALVLAPGRPHGRGRNRAGGRLRVRHAGGVRMPHGRHRGHGR